jgi:hypothetical protein
MLEAEKSFRRLKAHKQLPILRAALLRPQQALFGDQPIAKKIWPHRIQPTVPAAPISTGTGTIRLSSMWRHEAAASRSKVVATTTVPAARDTLTKVRE